MVFIFNNLKNGLVLFINRYITEAVIKETFCMKTFLVSKWAGAVMTEIKCANCFNIFSQTPVNMLEILNVNFPKTCQTNLLFDTVFRRPYPYFSIASKRILSVFDRYKIFPSDCLWIEVCQTVVLTKIDITMVTINKKLEIDKSRILRNLDLLRIN